MKHQNANRETNELSRLLCAAVVSPRFRNQLLREPEKALRAGYQSESFNLAPTERTQVLSVQAVNLADFASQLIDFQTRRQCTTIPVDLPQEAVLGSAFIR